MSRAVELVEQAYSLVTRYEETRDAALLGDQERCVEWLQAANLFLAAHREWEEPPTAEELQEARDWQRVEPPGIEGGE